VKRALVAMTVTGALWLGLAPDAQAQSLVTPCGPMTVKAAEPVRDAILKYLTYDYIYPGRTMGGGTRILRSNPPPSFLWRRKE